MFAFLYIVIAIAIAKASAEAQTTTTTYNPTLEQLGEDLNTQILADQEEYLRSMDPEEFEIRGSWIRRASLPDVARMAMKADFDIGRVEDYVRRALTRMTEFNTLQKRFYADLKRRDKEIDAKIEYELHKAYENLIKRIDSMKNN